MCKTSANHQATKRSSSFDKDDWKGNLVPYKRVAKIEIRRDTGVNLIKFVYSDGSEGLYGHDGGNKDSRTCVLAEDEYLTQVTHEQFENYYSAAAAITFVTNFGRKFEYKPRLATGLKDQLTTLKAANGNQITALNINKGHLLGIVEHPAPIPADRSKENWYVVASYNGKNDDYDLTEEEKDALGLLFGFNFESFKTLPEAKKRFNELRKAKRKGNTTVLLDCKKMCTVKYSGNPMDVVQVESEAIKLGFILGEDKTSVSISKGINTLASLLGESSDKRNFGLILSLLASSSYFDLYASLVTGKVLTMFDSSSESDDEGKFSWVNSIYCVFGDCSGEDPNQKKKALILGYTIVMVLKSFLYVLNVYFHHLACDRKNAKMRADCFEKVLSLDQAFFDTKSMTEIRGSMQVESINNTITWNIPYLIARMLKLMIATYFMVTISVELAFIAITSMIAVQIFVLTPIQRKSTAYQKNESKIRVYLDQIKDEALDMMSTIKMFSNEEHHTNNYARGQAHYSDHLFNVVFLRVLKEFTYSNAQSLSFALVLYWGIIGNAHNSVTSASLTGFFLLFSECQGVFGSLKWHWEQFERDFPSIERFVALMKEESRLAEKTVTKELPKSTRGEIVFDDVQFEYPSRPEESALKGLSFKITPRKMTAVVGDSGAGKSTIIKMIMRMYDVREGAVYVDGQDVRDISLANLHNRISIVPQTPDLFNTSIKENIAYGLDREVSMQEIIDAAKLANCYDFIMKFSNKFDTIVGNRGTQLSVGQKQRLAIARAAIRKPQVLLLDEATSALDAENEALVSTALEKLMVGRTTVVVAHRLCTIQNADEVICMKDGAVIESGGYAELIEKKGDFFRLVQKQMTEEKNE